MDNDWSSKAFSKRLFFPDKLFFIKLITWEPLLSEFLLFNFASCLLFFCCSLTLVLKIKSDWQLEVQLNSTALMGSSEGIVHFDVNFGSVKGTFTFVKLPWLSIFV